MKTSSVHYINELIERYPTLDSIRNDIENTIKIICECFKNGNKLLICGNGGSEADAEHIVGELMKGFVLSRKLSDFQQRKLQKLANGEYFIANLQQALPAISLGSHSALMTAFANDQAPDLVFAQQVIGYGKQGDVLLAISTSGNSSNILHASSVALAFDMQVIGLTGGNGGKLKQLAQTCIVVPENETFKIQELHLPVYHVICLVVENEFFSE